MSILQSLNWTEVRGHYDARLCVHQNLLALYKEHRFGEFAQLLLGISNPAGNYSAEEHGLGPRILANNFNGQQRVFALAGAFINLNTARNVPTLIRQAALRHLGIGVGSEASCMLNPEVCWIANTRTVWAHLLVKHNDNVTKAEQELRLYRDGDESSEMVYAKWADIHAVLEVALTRLGEDGQKQASAASLEPGTITYLWADAIAAYLYTEYRGYSGVLRH
jgi:hypothetical protein